MRLGPAICLACALAAVPALTRAVRADDKTPAKSDEKPFASSADVVDQDGITMTVMDPTLVRPSTGLFGGGKGEKVKELTVWKGAHQIIIALADIAKIEVTGKADRDFIPVRVSLRNGDALDGKVESALELHGTLRDGQYQIVFDKVKTITLHP
ncbi:MAG: hypothetical protein ACRELB_22195 [Polyangiaceae bacterium]